MSDDEKTEVMAFADTVGESYKTTVAETLAVDTADVAITCLYRTADEAKLDLLTLEKTCGAPEARRLAPLTARPSPALLARRLAGDGFGVEVEMTGDAVSTADRGQSAITDDLAAADVEIETGGVTVTADVLDVGVVISTATTGCMVSPTPAPTPNPTRQDHRSMEQVMVHRSILGAAPLGLLIGLAIVPVCRRRYRTEKVEKPEPSGFLVFTEENDNQDHEDTSPSNTWPSVVNSSARAVGPAPARRNSISSTQSVSKLVRRASEELAANKLSTYVRRASEELVARLEEAWPEKTLEEDWPADEHLLSHVNKAMAASAWDGASLPVSGSAERI